MKPGRSPLLLAYPTSRRSLRDQRPTGVRPAERLGEHPIEVGDEVQELAAQVRHRRERPPTDHLPHDHPEDDLDLVQPRAVLRQIYEPDAVTRTRQERLPARHRL